MFYEGAIILNNMVVYINKKMKQMHTNVNQVSIDHIKGREIISWFFRGYVFDTTDLTNDIKRKMLSKILQVSGNYYK
jgi:hypothetical protein